MLRYVVPFILTFLVAPVAFRIAHRTGIPASFLLSALFGAMAGWAGRHTEDSRKLAEDVAGAAHDLGWNGKQIAAALNVSESRYSAMQHGREMFSANYLYQAGAAFRRAWGRRLLAREGVLAIENETLASLLHEVVQLKERVGRKEVA